MRDFSRAGRTRLILSAGIALLTQAYTGNAQDLPASDPLPAGQIRMIEPVGGQPTVEPTVGGTPVAGEVALFPADATVVEVTDGKETAVGVTETPRRFRLLLGLTASAIYDDNIFLEERNKDSDFVFTITPTIGIGYGDPRRNYLSLTYSPSLVFFADHSDEDAVEHAVSLQASRHTDRWHFDASFDFRALTGASSESDDDVEQLGERVGERVDRRTYFGALRAAYAVSDKTSVEVGFAGSYTDYDEFFDTLDLVNQNYVDYKVTGKTTLGLGFGIGYAKSEGGPDQVYEQANLRVRYTPTSKLIFSANGGVEFRQVQGGEDQVNGVFGLGVAYTPFEHTVLTLDGYRRVRPSSVVAQSNYVVTGVVLTARQRFLRRFYASVAAGYENTEYESLDGGSDFPRQDDYFFIRPAVEFRVRERATVELFYEYRNNGSSREEFEFANNRAGVRFGLSF